MTNVNQTASDNAEEFGFHAGDLVQEWLWDDDVDDSIRAKIEELTGEELVDEDYDSAVDGVIIWWRDGDDEDELADTIVDAYAVLGDDGPLWVLTPKPGRPGARKLQHRAVRGQDRRHERRHSADRQLRLERYSPARVRQGQVNQDFFAIFLAYTNVLRAHWAWGISLLRGLSGKTQTKRGRNVGKTRVRALILRGMICDSLIFHGVAKSGR